MLFVRRVIACVACSMSSITCLALFSVTLVIKSWSLFKVLPPVVGVGVVGVSAGAVRCRRRFRWCCPVSFSLVLPGVGCRFCWCCPASLSFPLALPGVGVVYAGAARCRWRFRFYRPVSLAFPLVKPAFGTTLRGLCFSGLSEASYLKSVGFR